MLTKMMVMLLACCLFTQSSATAQQTGTADAWGAVSSRSAGETLKIRRKDGSAVTGKLRSTNDAGLVVETKKKELSLSRDEIASVSILGKRSAGKSALIGTLVGGGAGAGVGAGIGAGQSTFILSRGDNVAIGAVIFGLAGAAAGGLIGFLSGRAGHKETLIYQALPAK